MSMMRRLNPGLHVKVIVFPSHAEDVEVAASSSKLSSDLLNYSKRYPTSWIKTKCARVCLIGILLSYFISLIKSSIKKIFSENTIISTKYKNYLKRSPIFWDWIFGLSMKYWDSDLAAILTVARF